MLTIQIPGEEYWDADREEFICRKATTLALEHSLLSLSKWESKWHVPFLDAKNGLTPEQMQDYVRCMTLNKGVPDEAYRHLTQENCTAIYTYMNDPMTATWFREDENTNKAGPRSGKSTASAVTSEVLYYDMVELGIPFECEKWHLNRLLTLIRVCNEKHKHTKSDITDFPALGTAAAKNAGDFAAASHTHDYAGSSSAGGAANSANKLNKNAGSATQGVYFKDGVPVAMTYTLGKSVPADAKFTDTNTWRGIQDNLTSTATDQSLSANQGKVLKGLVDGKAASSHTHDDRYYTESEMNAKLNGKANSSHTHNYAGSGSAGGTANSVNGLTFAAQTTDPGAGSALTTNKVLIVYV